MSFILDALKKSERERQRTAVPGISDLPVVVHSSRTSPWALVAIATSLIGAAALAWVWWQSPSRSTVMTVAAPAPAETRAASRPGPVARPTPANPAPPTTRSLASEATRVTTTQGVAPPPTAPSPSPTAATTARVTQPASGTVTDAPMSILEARATGMSVPELALELLVYSDDPRQRFIYVNAAKYVEGDTLAEGPRVVEISTDGAVLTFNGQTFLLPQN